MKWRDEHYVTIHTLARSGMGFAEIARVIGVTKKTMTSWRKARPAVEDAFKRGRKGNEKRKENPQTFIEYVYEHVPEHLQECMDEILACAQEGTGVARVEALLRNQGKQARQHLFMHSLVTANFNASRACSMVNISRQTLEDWILKDPDFGDLMDEIHWHKKNYCEAGLFSMIDEGNVNAIIFANRTLNKDRGYSEKVEIEVSGTVQHNHTVIAIDSLDLPLPVRQTLLDAIRAGKMKILETNGATNGQSGNGTVAGEGH